MYRRSIRCATCGYSLIAERQKGHIYYRCHTKRCLAKSVKEEIVTAAVLARLKTLQFADAEYNLLKQMSQREASKTENETEKRKTQLLFRQGKIRERLARLLDAYMDGVIDKESYLARKNALVLEEQALKQELLSCDRNSAEVASEFGNFLELANSAYLSFKSANPENRRVLVKTITSNFTTDGKSISIEMKNPFKTLSERVPFTVGSPCRDTTRTLFAELCEVLKIFGKSEPAATYTDIGLKA